MPDWDYAGNGLYFITLVTRNRECNLGEIVVETIDRTINKKQAYMKLSGFGRIVDNEWKKSFELRTELYCDEYVIMPNHLHAIIILQKQNNDKINNPNGLHNEYKSHKMHDPYVETHGRASLQSPQLHGSKLRPQFFRKPKSISSFIGGFKSAINAKIDNYIDEHKLNIPKYNHNNHFFQPNYHDRVIRDEDEYIRIKKYILDNPLKWNNYTFNSFNTETGYDILKST